MKRPPSLVSPRDFRRVLAEGRTVRTGWASIHTAPTPTPAAPSRLGLAVSAHSGGAVERNRIKRRLRAAFRAAAPAAGLDVVVRARAATATADFQELETTMAGLRT